MKYNSDFGWDLSVGQMAERSLAHIFTDSKIEVKLDRHTIVTGNLAVEYECRNKPSGIAITKADYWCFVIQNGAGANILYLIIPVDRLKKLCRRHYRKGAIKNVGDNGVSKVVLVPFKECVF